MPGRRALALVAVSACLALALAPAHAGKKSDAVVKITAKATAPDAAGKQTLTVTLVHDKGWHTYANPVGNDDLSENRTIIKVDAKTKPVSVKIDYPVGKVKEDKDAGDHRIYEDTLVIKATIQRAAGDISPLKVDVTICACDANFCLPRATVPLTVP